MGVVQWFKSWISSADWAHLKSWWLMGIVGVITFFVCGFIAWKGYSCLRNLRRNHKLSNQSREKLKEDIPKGFAKKQFTMELTFSNLGLKLNKSGKVVLRNVSGTIRNSRMTAVMGPSGSGKTTFMTTLAGRAYYGKMMGTLNINGKRDKISNYKNITGFVPQEDIMLREMTVYETLKFSAFTRLPSTMKDSQKYSIIESVMKLLDITHLRYSQIGDENVRGISGGQRKRVNIGMELVAQPTLLFLDEPTSGLDSSSTMSIIGALRKVSELGMTIIAVIHQPRYEVFTMFHDVLLLGNGGRTIYLGPSSSALAYFEYLGFECPQHCNPSDFFMDVIAGDIPKVDGTVVPPSELPDLWIKHREIFQSQHPEEEQRFDDHHHHHHEQTVVNDNDDHDAQQNQQRNEQISAVVDEGSESDHLVESSSSSSFNHSVNVHEDDNDDDVIEDGDTVDSSINEINSHSQLLLNVIRYYVLARELTVMFFQRSGIATFFPVFSLPRQELGLISEKKVRNANNEGSYIAFYFWMSLCFLFFVMTPIGVLPYFASIKMQYGSLIGCVLLLFLGIFSIMLMGLFSLPIFSFLVVGLIPVIALLAALIFLVRRWYYKDFRPLPYVPQIVGGAFYSILYVWYMWNRRNTTIALRLAALFGFVLSGYFPLIITVAAIGLGAETSSLMPYFPFYISFFLAYALVVLLLLRRVHIFPVVKIQVPKYVPKEEKEELVILSSGTRRPNWLLSQMPLIFLRSIIQYSRHWLASVFDLFLVISAGLFVGIIYYNQYYIPPPYPVTSDCTQTFPDIMCKLLSMPGSDPLSGQASITCLALALAAMASSIRVFGNEMVVFRRESEGGVSTEAYYIGKSLAHLPTEILAPLFFTLFYYAIALPTQTPFFEFFALYLLIYMSCTGLAYFISLITTQALSQLAGVLTILSFMMFSGASPTLSQLKDNELFPDILYYCSYLSIFRWTQETYYLIAIKPYDPEPGTGTLAYYSYSVSDLKYCWLALGCLCILFRVLAYIALIVREKRR